ncbi:interferon regulatory factor 8-like [Tubulanus polymorphus]|uniref:interferon regulatory factor 8-like n=1 Tax=Tubulanus polymorphus TaxID=672921 RepID=UPI003DA513E9
MSTRPPRLREFLLDILNDEADRAAEWTDRRDGKFRVRWMHARKPGWDESRDTEIFKRWINRDGTGPSDTTSLPQMKQNFRCVMERSQYFKKIKAIEPDDGYRYYQFVDWEVVSGVELMDVDDIIGPSENGVADHPQKSSVQSVNPMKYSLNAIEGGLVSAFGETPDLQFFSLEIHYSNVVVLENTALQGKSWRINYGIEGHNLSVNSKEEEMAKQLYGPRDVQVYSLPSVVSNDKTEEILLHLGRGIILEYDDTCGDIYVERLCALKVYFQGFGCADSATPIKRYTRTKVFSYDAFDRAALLYQKQQGLKPSALVMISFGKEWNSPYQIVKTAALALVTNNLAKRLLDELSKKMGDSSLEISSLDVLDMASENLKMRQIDQLRISSDDWDWLEKHD